VALPAIAFKKEKQKLTYYSLRNAFGGRPTDISEHD